MTDRSIKTYASHNIFESPSKSADPKKSLIKDARYSLTQKTKILGKQINSLIEAMSANLEPEKI